MHKTMGDSRNDVRSGGEPSVYKDNSRDDMQKLFLLEVLVDNLFIQTESSSPNLNKDLAANMADTCVMFQFLHYPPLVVCESDFIGTAVSSKDTSNITFKSGKSCFFSLRTPKGPILPVPFEVNVSVIRKMKEGVLPDKLELGKTLIDMGENFTELLKQNTDENFCDSLPLSKIKKGTFDIKDDGGRKVGNLTAFLRLSCFGKLIITQFSLNKEDEKSYLFKGTDLKEVCQNDPGLGMQQESKLQGKDDRQPTIPGQTRGAYVRASDPPKPPTKPLSPWEQSQVETFDPQRGPGPTRGANVRASDPPRPPTKPLSPWEQSQAPTLNQWQGPGPVRGDPYAAQYPQGPQNMGPSPWGQSQPPMYNQWQGPGPMRGDPYSSPRGPPPPSGMGGGRLCECPYPVPPNVMAKYSQRPDKNLNLAPGEVGMQDDQVIFQLPLKKQGDPLTDRDQQIDSQVYYKLTSAEETRDGVQKNTVNVKSDDIPGMATKTVSPVSGLPVDDGHDVFLLKIGKKCEGDKKRNLELELRTPKMKEPKPPMTDKDTQYLESDIPKTSKKGSKDKGKGKKGSKAGKGGKGGKKGKK